MQGIEARHTDLERIIKGEMARRGIPTLRRLDVDVAAGVARVRGTVDSFYEKQLATISCQKTPGVKIVLNEVHVRPAEEATESADNL